MRSQSTAVELGHRQCDVDGGVVDDAVEPAEALAHGGDDALHLLFVADVERQRDGVDAALAEQRGAVLRALQREVGDDDAHAGFAEHLRDGRAETARAAGDDEGLAAQRVVGMFTLCRGVDDGAGHGRLRFAETSSRRRTSQTAAICKAWRAAPASASWLRRRTAVGGRFIGSALRVGIPQIEQTARLLMR